MSLNITQTAAERKAVQGNAAVYFAGSQENFDDRQAALDAWYIEQTNQRANVICEWCSCVNYKDAMAEEAILSIDVSVVDGNTLSLWEADLISYGYLANVTTSSLEGAPISGMPTETKTLVISLPN